MRTIKFRGKEPMYGQWVYGDLVTTPTKCFVDVFQVNPETVGQFTGLQDKNGNNIYEGDILAYHCSDGDKDYGIVRYGLYRRPSEVNFSHMGFYVDWGDDMCRGDLGYWVQNRVEKAVVAGNIHDNPELMLNFKNSR